MAPRKPASKPKPPRGHYTVHARDTRAEQRARVVEDVRRAAAHCRSHSVGVKAALATGHFPEATRGKVAWELKRGTSDDDSPRDANQQLLTNAERLKLASWVLARADVHDPQNRHQISVKVRAVLAERHRFNKTKKYGKGTIPLNTPELNHLNSNIDLSHTFFQRIYPWWRARGIDITEGVSRAEEEKRSQKHREAVVENHFFGEYGLERELIDAGVMDPHTKLSHARLCLSHAHHAPRMHNANPFHKRSPIGNQRPKTQGGC